MAVEFKLPEVAEGVESADVAELLVNEGDVIEAGQIVMEVETDKSVAEIECPHAGRVARVHVAVGDSVGIGATLLTIEAADAAPAESAPAESAPAESAPAEPAPEAAASIEPASSSDTATVPETSQPVQAESAGSTGVAAAEVNAPKAASAEVGRRAADKMDRVPAPAGPATRRLARKLGVDLYEVNGSGPGGRITSEDIQGFVRQRLAGGGMVVGGGPVAAPALPDFSKFGSVVRQPLNKIAKTSAANLGMAWNVIPHVTQHDLCDITELEAARRRFVNGAGKGGPKITMTALAIKACVAALRAFPQFNSSLDPQTMELVVKQYYHIGVAVDTEHGLLVPVIRDCDRKTVIEIAAELTEIAEKARNRKLDISQMQGATFTITNLGGIGGTSFTPIVNYPEVAILGMSRGRKELALEDGQVTERLMLPLSLSYDHRVVNGADAAKFIVTVSSSLRDYFQLMAFS